MHARCRAALGGEHDWSKPNREMVQRCECGAQRVFPKHKAVWKRVPPQFGGSSDLQMCSVCGYVRSGPAGGTIDARIHE